MSILDGLLGSAVRIMRNGIVAALRPAINFTGNVSVSDDAENNATKVEVLSYFGSTPPVPYDGNAGRLVVNRGDGTVGFDSPTGGASIVANGQQVAYFASGGMALSGGLMQGPDLILHSSSGGVGLAAANATSGSGSASTGVSIDLGVGDGAHAGQAGPITVARNGTPMFAVYTGSGTPEGVITATRGSLYLRTDGGAATTLYVKESGTGNTGWAGK